MNFRILKGVLKRMTRQDFLFLDSTSGAASNELRVTEGSEELTLQVELLSGSSCSLTVMGRTDILADAWQPLFAIDLSHLDAVTEIVEDGIYSIPVGGIMGVKIVNGGTVGAVKAYGRILG